MHYPCAYITDRTCCTPYYGVPVKLSTHHHYANQPLLHNHPYFRNLTVDISDIWIPKIIKTSHQGKKKKKYGTQAKKMDEQTNKFAVHAACREGKCERVCPRQSTDDINFLYLPALQIIILVLIFA